MGRRLMRKTAILTILFTVAAMSVMLLTASKKMIVLSDVAQDEVSGEPGEEGLTPEISLQFTPDNTKSDYLCIPVKPGIRAEDVVIENHYVDHELWIVLADTEQDFYGRNKLSGNQDKILSGVYERTSVRVNGRLKEGIRLKFRLTEVCEYRTILEENSLYIQFFKPKQIYDKIVVIDPACGGNDTGIVAGGIREKDLTLLIARQLKSRLDEQEIKAYYTRMDDENPTQSRRVYLAEETEADMLIRIEAGESLDPDKQGTETVYNPYYFIPGFGSIELSDLLEREVVTAIRGKAGGLVPMEEQDTVIRLATVPVSCIRVGYLTNSEEAQLLSSKSYLDKIAAGIYETILKAYEQMENK